MFRREKPQKGRYRQFHQMSVEALGFAEPEIDAELIAMSARLWRDLGLTSAKLELNSIGTAESREGTSRCSSSTSRAHRELLDEDSVRRLERNPLRILDSKNPALRELIEAAPLLSGHLDDESRAHFDRVQALLGDVGVPFTLNPRLVRGLDYYSRTVFEWSPTGSERRARSAPAGVTTGLWRSSAGARRRPSAGHSVSSASSSCCRPRGGGAAEAAPDAHLVAVGDAERRFGFKLAEQLRERVPGLRLSIGRPAAGFKAQLRRADKSGARFALIVGEAELQPARSASNCCARINLSGF